MALPDAVHAAMFSTAPTVPVGSATNVWGPWTEIWRYTNSDAETKKYLFAWGLLADASWTPSGGGDRAGVEYRITTGSAAAGDASRTIHYNDLFCYIRNGPAGYDEVTRATSITPTEVADLAQNEFVLIEARGISQARQYAASPSPNAVHTLEWPIGENYVTRQELHDETGASGGGGVTLTQLGTVAALSGVNGTDTGVDIPETGLLLVTGHPTQGADRTAIIDAATLRSLTAVTAGTGGGRSNNNWYSSVGWRDWFFARTSANDLLMGVSGSTWAITIYSVGASGGGGGSGLDQAAVDARVRAGVQDWAEAGNATIIPANKLPTILTQAQVDARVQAGVADPAEQGNTTRWGKGKLPSDTIYTATQRFTTADETKLDGIAAGAEVNVQPDWDATTGDAAIQNKPTILTEAQVDARAAIAAANRFTGNDARKLDGIEAGATADQTGAEMVTALSGLSGSARLPASAVRDLPSGGGGLTQAQVDARVEAGVQDWAEAGDNTIIPSGKLPPIPSDADIDERADSRVAAYTQEYTQTEKDKLAGIASGAEVNVNPDWDAISGDAVIQNKPVILSEADVRRIVGEEGGGGGGGGGNGEPVQTDGAIDVRSAAVEMRSVALTDHALAFDATGAVDNAMSADPWSMISSLLGRASGVTYVPSTRVLTIALEGTWEDITVTLPEASETAQGLVRFARQDELSGSQTADNLALDIAALRKAIRDNDPVISDLLELIASATGDKLESVVSDGTLAGAGTTDDPLRVAVPFTSAEKSKLDGLSSSGEDIHTDATLDGTGSSTNPLRVANPFSHGDETKLDGIEAGATADQTGAEIVSKLEGLTGGARLDSSAIKNLPGAQGVTGLTSVASDASLSGDGTSSSPLSVAHPFTATDEAKLDGIEDNATADQTGAQLIAALRAESTAAATATQEGIVSLDDVDGRIADWAQQGNTEAIPASKLTNAPSGTGGLDQAAVDARIAAEVADWAEEGNTDAIPANKLTNAPSGTVNELAPLATLPAATAKDEGVIANKTGELWVDDETSGNNVLEFVAQADPQDRRILGEWDFDASAANHYGEIEGTPVAYARMRWASSGLLTGGRANSTLQVRVPKSVQATKRTDMWLGQMHNLTNGFYSDFSLGPAASLDTTNYWGYDQQEGAAFPLSAIKDGDDVVVTFGVAGETPVPVKSGDAFRRLVTPTLHDETITGTGEHGSPLSVANALTAAERTRALTDEYVDSFALTVSGQALQWTVGRTGALDDITGSVNLPTTTPGGAAAVTFAAILAAMTGGNALTEAQQNSLLTAINAAHATPPSADTLPTAPRRDQMAELNAEVTAHRYFTAKPVASTSGTTPVATVGGGLGSIQPDAPTLGHITRYDATGNAGAELLGKTILAVDTNFVGTPAKMQVFDVAAGTETSYTLSRLASDAFMYEVVGLPSTALQAAHDFIFNVENSVGARLLPDDTLEPGRYRWSGSQWLLEASTRESVESLIAPFARALSPSGRIPTAQSNIAIHTRAEILAIIAAGTGEAGVVYVERPTS